MPPEELIGLLAGCCTTAAFVPQVWRVWARKSAEDVSLAMFCVFATGVLLWLAYGLIVSSPSVIVANLATLVLAVTLVMLTVRYRRLARAARLAAAPITEEVGR